MLIDIRMYTKIQNESYTIISVENTINNNILGTFYVKKTRTMMVEIHILIFIHIWNRNSHFGIRNTYLYMK